MKTCKLNLRNGVPNIIIMLKSVYFKLLSVCDKKKMNIKRYAISKENEKLIIKNY